tara:strand:- start:327 stop:1352 length:1026 start_codon:yes stop_codon:yes gene_type:complete
MLFKNKNIKKITKKEWNNFCKLVGDFSPFTSFEMMEYYSAFKGVKNISFVVFNEAHDVVATVPLATFKDSMSFGDYACPSIVVDSKLSSSMRKKIFSYIFIEIKKIMLKKKITSYFFCKHAFQSIFIKGSHFLIDNFFEHFQFSKIHSIGNTLILNLQEQEMDIFNNMSKYHKKNIKKVQAKNLTFENSLDLDKPDNELLFKDFKKQHSLNAKKSTRPKKTWDLMRENLIKKNSCLTVAKLGKKSISYLYIGFNEYFAFGWSQVNDKKYEKEYMPRHFLEWEAIKYLKNNGFKYYDIGESYTWHQKKISNKQYSISSFKEKFGSRFFPKFIYKLKVSEINN